MLEKCQLLIETLEDLKLDLRLFYQDTNLGMTLHISEQLIKPFSDRQNQSKLQEM